jgi:peptidyl-prolyl cis-trans isomerase SurA
MWLWAGARVSSGYTVWRILAAFFDDDYCTFFAFWAPGRMMTMVGKVSLFVVGSMLMLMAGVASTPALADGIRVTVNDTAITDLAIAQRSKLFALEGHKTNQTQGAKDELINEALEMQEAKRLGITVSDAQVSDAFLNVSRNLKLSPDKLTQVLQGNGVGIATLKDRLRAAIAWNGVTQQAIMPRVQISDLALEKKAESKVTAANSFDYVLKEVLFIMPGGKGSASARSGQANQYRAAFKGCDSAVPLSLKYTDVAVTDVGRRHATQLPDATAAEMAKLNVGGITKPRVVQGGVSMLAICSKEEAKDLTFIKGAMRNDAGNSALKDEADKYLADLKSKAHIVNH